MNKVIKKNIFIVGIILLTIYAIYVNYPVNFIGYITNSASYQSVNRDTIVNYYEKVLVSSIVNMFK